MTIKIGTTFTHKHFLHPDDRHLPAKEARKALMKVTSVNKTRVYYTYADGDNKGRWYMPRKYFLETYGSQKEEIPLQWKDGGFTHHSEVDDRNRFFRIDRESTLPDRFCLTWIEKDAATKNKKQAGVRKQTTIRMQGGWRSVAEAKEVAERWRSGELQELNPLYHQGSLTSHR